MSDWRTPALGLLAIAVLVLAAWDYSLSSALSAGRSRTYEMNGQGVMAGAHATVTEYRRAGFALVNFSGLPPPGAGLVYELWLVGFDGSRAPGGVFQADAAGGATVLVGRGLEGKTALEVTAEPTPAGSRQPSRPALLTGKL